MADTASLEGASGALQGAQKTWSEREIDPAAIAEFKRLQQAAADEAAKPTKSAKSPRRDPALDGPDRETARAAGFNDAEIDAYLAAKGKREGLEAKFDRFGARNAGWADFEIDRHLDSKLDVTEQALLGPKYNGLRDALLPRTDKDDLRDARVEIAKKFDRAKFKAMGLSDEVIDYSIERAARESMSDGKPLQALYLKLRDFIELFAEATSRTAQRIYKSISDELKESSPVLYGDLDEIRDMVAKRLKPKPYYFDAEAKKRAEKTWEKVKQFGR